MVRSIDSSISKIIAGLSEADIRRSLGDNTRISVETEDAIAGDSGDDLIVGGPENDLLMGDLGNDTIYGGNGNNTLFGGTGHLLVEDWEGQDFLVGGPGDDLIFGNQADDTLYGGDGDDTLYGGKDNDRLYGNGGNDVLFGDLGSDSLWGGEGQNRFQIGRRFDVPGFLSTGGPTLDGADWIMDFTPGQDLIGLLGGLTFDELNIFAGTGENAGDTIIQDTMTQEYLAIVKNISPEAIARGDFSPYTPPPIPLLPNLTPPVINSTPDIPSPSANEPEVDPIDEPQLSYGTISFSGIRSFVLEDGTPVREVTLIRQNGQDGEVSVTLTLSNGTTPDSQSDRNPSVIVRFADGETEKTVTIPVSENDLINLQNNFSVILSNPTGGAIIAFTDPVVVSPSESEQPDSILFPDDNFRPTPEDEPSNLSPDVSSPTEEIEADEPSDLSPDVTPEIEDNEEEDLDLEPDVTPEIEDPDETPPIEDEEGDDPSGEIEDDPIDENGGDDSSDEDSEPGITVSYADATSGIIADLSEGIVTRLFTTDDEVAFKILPLGDSNTRGFPNNNAIGGYRTRLWERLVEDNGFNIDFVGQANSGPPSIDRNHEGRGGFTITHLIDNTTNPFTGYNQPTAPLYTTIEDALNYAQPDAVLLMAGTNDIIQNKPVETALTDLGILVDRIVETMPNTQVLVSSIIPNTSNATRQQRTSEFSEQVEEEVVATRANSNPNIRFVDLFNLPFVAGDYDNDGIHLKASGYDKLADEWYAQIRMLPSGEETLTDVQHIIGSAYDDTLIGDDQANIIRGGEGNDWLIGGAGEDTFILASGEGTNTIADFESGSDRIGLTDGLEFEQLLISAGSDASQTQIALADTGESLAILLGIDASMINPDDFILV